MVSSESAPPVFIDQRSRVFRRDVARIAAAVRWCLRGTSQRPILRAVILAVLVHIAVHANDVSAYPVTFEFAGQITVVNDDDDVLGGAVVVGSEFFGSYTFESSTPDQRKDDPSRGVFDDSITSIAGELGALSFAGPTGTSDRIRVQDGFPPPDLDAYNVSANVLLLDRLVGLRLELFDASGLAFGVDALPL